MNRATDTNIFAGALLFGVGCELAEVEELRTEQRVDPTGLDDSMGYESEAVIYEAVIYEDQTSDTSASPMAISSAIWEPGIDGPGPDAEGLLYTEAVVAIGAGTRPARQDDDAHLEAGYAASKFTNDHCSITQPYQWDVCLTNRTGGTNWYDAGHRGGSARSSEEAR